MKSMLASLFSTMFYLLIGLHSYANVYSDQNHTSGIVLEEGLKSQAKGFYQAFAHTWQHYPESREAVIRLHQQGSPVLGQQLVVEYKGDSIFQLPLSFQSQDLDHLAQLAAQRLADIIQMEQKDLEL